MKSGRLDNIIRVEAAREQVWPVQLVGPARSGVGPEQTRIRRARAEIARRAREELGMSDGEIAAELGIKRLPEAALNTRPRK